MAKEQCRAVLQALQMTTAQIAALKADPTLIGSYQLLAPINGRVQQDNTRLGELQEAGSVLLQLTDESSLWVVAEMTPQQSAQLTQANELLVSVGATMARASIIGRAHELSSSTRTERLIAQLDNRQTYWHAGQFAEVFLPQPEQPGVLLPDAALSRSEDGDWQVFVETAAGFRAQEVQVQQQQRGMNLVTGIAPGTPVVIAGAFFLASELAKSGFDVHNH
ncbi:efflux RND transporter periplasmic adaptor subunit [Shewanella dokdonensis]|uniref:Efflux RND transporter periplasmic adaptor subunit n=1 Tax=Shewanella dokdonensis TaxID=712036 RepID=A0ABX8DB60_9GAMM|nr:efflux RND transporter periplasmic adaptor subunit [Shewanella dokdonensis]QVK22068.1 efflux RND transporter periplasmic adaptor subunit [Shewanella dokdonensis]